MGIHDSANRLMKSEGLPRNVIIRHRLDFERMFEKGKRKNGRFIRLIFIPTGKPVVAGFVCSKKNGNAVKRNLYRRRMREAFRKNKSAFDGYEIIFMALPQIANASFKEIETDILEFAGKLK